MTTTDNFFVWRLFQQLRRRDFALGPDEYQLLRRALAEDFGWWSSRARLRELCVALWAKSVEERAVVAALFDQLVAEDWNLEAPAPTVTPTVVTPGQPGSDAGNDVTKLESIEPGLASPTSPPAEDTTIAPTTNRLPPLQLGEVPALPYEHVFLPQYPVSFRATAQAWRRLRWPVREGPKVELDVDATIQRRSRAGIVSPPVLRARRRNRARLLILVDRQGSMAPFHAYVDDVCQAIGQAGRLHQVATFYFHDVPSEGADADLVRGLRMFDNLDSVMSDIPPSSEGEFFIDKDLVDAVPLQSVLSRYAQDSAVLIISDAGAARGSYDLRRLLNTIAFLKALHSFANRMVWLNPLPSTKWSPSSAAGVARHLPMFAMDQEGMHRAVNVLRGQPYSVSKPIRSNAVLPQRSGETKSVLS